MTRDILERLDALLRSGIMDEAQVVYLMAGIRKLLERKEAKEQYKYLKFHCDRTLHSKLEGTAAQDVLKYFDAANWHLKAGAELRKLPADLRREIDNISQMKHFEEELDSFLKGNSLPSIDTARHDGWIHFLHLYAKVVEGCPLVISQKNADNSDVVSVTVDLELAKQPVDDNLPFKVTWTVEDKNGRSGSLFIINSFSLKP